MNEQPIGRPEPKTTITLKVFRYKPGAIDPPRYDIFQVEADPYMTVIDALEEIRTTQDPTLAYRHSCHHASCGTCAMRINHREGLACVTKVLEEKQPILVEPLGSMTLLADLVVDMGDFARRFEPAGLSLCGRASF
jgi:succinate dehydrogenase / fumarate reductase iron-sulfur subunit